MVHLVGEKHGMNKVCGGHDAFNADYDSFGCAGQQ
jgi:hypothetical protein